MLSDKELAEIEARAKARKPDDDLSEESIALVAEVRWLRAGLRQLLEAQSGTARQVMEAQENARMLLSDEWAGAKNKAPAGPIPAKEKR